LISAFFAGCATGISPGLQQQAGAPVDFAALSANPEAYKGRLVILGGEVMSLEPWGQDGTLMTVNQQEMSQLGNPRGAPSGGTFVVESDKWLSPSTFQPKSTVKVADKERYGQFFRAMLESGIYLAPSAFEAGFMSTVHTDMEIEATVAAAEKAFKSW